MNKIKTVLFGMAGLLFGLVSCNVFDEDDVGNSKEVFERLYTPSHIPTLHFTINADIDNIITGEQGTRLRINKNTFVDSSGQPVKGKVDIELKEVLTIEDMVLANLTTTSDGKPLQTGGMIYVNATSNGKNIFIADNKEIKAFVPTDSSLSGMSIYEGKEGLTGMNWINPVKLPLPDSLGGVISQTFEKSTNVFYSVEGIHDTNKYPKVVDNEVARIAWEGDGLKLTKDTVIKIEQYTVTLHKTDMFQTWSQTFTNEKGRNSFAEDPNTSYIFSIKKLGWANIDRLLDDKRTTAVDLITSIENQDDFSFIYVTLVTKNMYLPGYQKLDNTFCFSHDDNEKQMLPVGETATILATAYKDDKPYFALTKITITAQQNVSMKLEETTDEKLKKELKARL